MSATPPSQDPHPVPRQSSPQAREPPQQTVTQQLVSHMMQRIWADIPDNHNFQLPFEHPLQYLATKNAYASVPEDFMKDSSRYAPHMGSLLWYSSGTMSLLVEEIIAVYPYLDDAEKHQKFIPLRN
ncbi:hypothetical protein BLNAU_25173 [Blattamonas nauphoetae]|uniref:Uncharacterized protein n=1 Tax=Blattamonas nauphoetae TaxID=2049346 RepID=A0ABQ9WKC4_9EUKA|nr:hypothetical protein BLNAU_25173 [Blattamonas nauphoetae]